MEHWKYVKTLLRCLKDVKGFTVLNAARYYTNGDNYMQLHGLVNTAIDLQITIKDFADKTRYAFTPAEYKLICWDAAKLERYTLAKYAAHKNMHELPFD